MDFVPFHIIQYIEKADISLACLFKFVGLHFENLFHIFKDEIFISAVLFLPATILVIAYWQKP